MEYELSIEFTRRPYIIRVRYDGEIIWEHNFASAVDWISTLHMLEDKNDKEIYDWAKGYATFTDGEE